MSSDPAIQLERVSKCYHTYRKPIHRLVQVFSEKRKLYEEFWALREIDLEIAKGETVGVVGQNGSGKSTLLQLIVGTLTPTTGSVRCDGRVSAILELGAGFNPEFTGLENARLNASIIGMSNQEIEDRLPAILEFSELGNFIDKPVKTYSSGMYIRLAFSVVINMSPDILVIDEALAVGDSRFQRKCFRKLDELRDQGTTIVFVTHATDTVISHCDRAVFMELGDIVKVGEPKDVVNTYLESMFDGGLRARSKQAAIDNEAPRISANRLNLDDEMDYCRLRPTYNDTEYEWGSGHARIVDYLVLDSAGAPVGPAVSAGTEISVWMAVRFYEARRGLIYALTIKTVDGTTVFGTNTDLLGMPTEAVSAGQTVVVKFDLPLNLISSEYFVSLGVVARPDYGEDDVLHRRYDLFHIQVQDNHRAFGYASLPATIEVSMNAAPGSGC